MITVGGFTPLKVALLTREQVIFIFQSLQNLSKMILQNHVFGINIYLEMEHLLEFPDNSEMLWQLHCVITFYCCIKVPATTFNKNQKTFQKCKNKGSRNSEWDWGQIVCCVRKHAVFCGKQAWLRGCIYPSMWISLCFKIARLIKRYGP